MNSPATAFLILAAISAVIHWWSVARKHRLVLVVTKPLTMVFLIALAATLDTSVGATRGWFVAALLLSMVGDVFLMLESDQFIAGLASFLLAHVAYVIGLALAGFAPLQAAISVAAVAASFAIVGKRILDGARATNPRLGNPVGLYVAVISAMLVTAVATKNSIAALGALSFYASDAILGWNRFVTPLNRGRLLTMITYHTGQALLVLALVSL